MQELEKTNTDLTIMSNAVSVIAESSDMNALQKAQKFQALLNKQPDPNGIGKTPDGKAKTVPISFIEMTLDELFFGQWSSDNFKWTAITNEIVGSIDLRVIHPITGKEIVRSGAAAIQIMVDKAPDNVQGQEKNRWALNPDNKKSNALDMGFPKLKAECLKNAAQSLGKIFGRDLNRKLDQVDTYQPLIKDEAKLNDNLKKLQEVQNGKA